MEEAEEAKAAKVEEKTPVGVKASWRELSVNNIESLACVADKIHPALQKETKSSPSASSSSHEAAWVSWKARVKSFAAMSSLIPSVYIHDLAILPKLQGRGLARVCINKLSAIAKQYPTTCLISVYGTQHFWSRLGFVPVQIDGVLQKKLLDYGDDVTYLERKNEEYQPEATTNTGPV